MDDDLVCMAGILLNTPDAQLKQRKIVPGGNQDRKH
jgi:hypothetical protein